MSEFSTVGDFLSVATGGVAGVLLIALTIGLFVGRGRYSPFGARVFPTARESARVC